ncbi:MAG: hypothetical protein WCF06_00640, partial [Nitrososphaeraceae archaeon]
SAWNAVTNFLIKLSLIPVAVIAPRNAQRAPIHYSLVLLRKSRKKINAMDSIMSCWLLLGLIDSLFITMRI